MLQVSDVIDNILKSSLVAATSTPCIIVFQKIKILLSQF